MFFYILGLVFFLFLGRRSGLVFWIPICNSTFKFLNKFDNKTDVGILLKLDHKYNPHQRFTFLNNTIVKLVNLKQM